MNKILENMYLYLYWRKQAYGYVPSVADVCKVVNISVNSFEKYAKELAREGYIKLYLYDNGDYDVKFIIEPKRPWVVNVYTTGLGIIQKIKSEIPIKVYFWKGDNPEPKVLLSSNDLDKTELLKKNIEC